MAAYVELTIEQGANFTSQVIVKDENNNPINLTGYSAAAQLRKSHYSVSATNFEVELTEPVSGQITISLNYSVTANLTPGKMVYDLLITDTSDIKTRIIEGIAVILPSATR